METIKINKCNECEDKYCEVISTINESGVKQREAVVYSLRDKIIGYFSNVLANFSTSKCDIKDSK